MNERFRVHSFQMESFAATLKLADGGEIEAQRPCAVIELEPIHSYGRTITLRIAVANDKELADLREKFAVGGQVEDRGWDLIAGPDGSNKGSGQ